MPTKPSERPAALQRSRDLYYQFCDEMVCTTPTDDDGATDHVRDALERSTSLPHGMWRLTTSSACFLPFSWQPLSMEPSSKWQSYFKDTEVLKQIDRDVRRTMPSLSFFQSRVSRANRHVLARAANLPFNLVRRVHLEATASKKAPPPPFPVRARSARTSRNRPC